MFTKPTLCLLLFVSLTLTLQAGNSKKQKKVTIINKTREKQFKIAVIDMEKVFYSYYKTKIADANLKKQAEVYRAYAEKLNESRLKLQNEFRELRDASLNVGLSETEKENKRIEAQDKYRQLRAKEAEYSQYNREKQAKLKDDYERKRKGIIIEIQKIVRKHCILEGYSIVMDSSGKTLNNIPTIVYFNPVIDMTDSILSELNRGHEEEIKKYSDTDGKMIKFENKKKGVKLK